jgi:hypothetical protein
MTFEIVVSVGRSFANTPDLVDIAGQDQPLDSPASSSSRAPERVVRVVNKDTISFQFVGLDLESTSDETVDAWAQSITNNIPNSVEVRRRSL